MDVSELHTTHVGHRPAITQRTGYNYHCRQKRSRSKSAGPVINSIWQVSQMVRLIPLFLDNDMIIIRPVHVTITQSGRTVVRTCAQISYSQCMNPRNVPVACPSGELSVQGRSPPHNGPECCSPDTLRPTLNRPFLGSRVVCRSPCRFSHVR
ncbi:hypothetical protein EDD17DRAFT_1018958 [Pisolithus thermaeus]|nr:hypothetical protein EDD17DRAFT_1018958 [Pisolithus thermaeus]